LPKFKISTIRARLLISFVLMTLLPAIVISLGSAAVGYQNGRQQAVRQLESAAALKELALRSWIHSLQEELVIASNTGGEFERISVVLDLARGNQYYAFYNKAVRNRLRSFVNQSQLLQELSLLDLQGRVALSTDAAQEGQVYQTTTFFQRGLTQPYAQLPFYASGSKPDASIAPGQTSVIVVIPVVSHDGQPLGVIAGRANVEPLNRLLREQTSLGQTGKAYLVDPQHAVLMSLPLQSAAAQPPHFVSTAGIDATLTTRTGNAGMYQDYRGVSVVGVYRWLPDLQVALAAEQDLSEAFQAVYMIVGVNLSIAVVAVLLAIVASLFITKSIATPLADLAGTAKQIAGGNLGRIAAVERDDEIGVLAQAFNSMTAQLRDLIDSLGRRIEERTRALQATNAVLERRALQLETSVHVSREITSILEIDTLMTQVVKLIRDAFGYYRVHVFLLDPEGRQLILRGSSGDTDPQLRQLEIDCKSINTRAVETGEAQMVNDVTQDVYYLPDAHLPDTRSELVIPLRLAHQVIGTLDVHSTATHAFTAEDALIIQSLGDQIAVAIENARLYNQSRKLAVLEERTRLARELHDSVTQSLYSILLLTEGWRRMVSSGENASVEDYFSRIGKIIQLSLKEMRLLIHELRPPALERDGLVGALRQRLDAVEKRAGVEARFLMEDLIELPPRMEEELYRIAEEALNNALKHAAATAVTMRLCHEGASVVLEISDNGRGFDPEIALHSGGMGLVNMRERVQQIGGSLTIASVPNQGTTVRASTPIGDIRLANVPARAPDRLEVTP
jgi:signal transduction histidine kinase